MKKCGVCGDDVVTYIQIIGYDETKIVCKKCFDKAMKQSKVLEGLFLSDRFYEQGEMDDSY